MAQETKETGTGLMSSKYWRLLLVILAGLFTFGAPYVTYLSSSLLKGGVFFSFTGGFLSLIIGLLLIWYLVKNKVIKWSIGKCCPTRFRGIIDSKTFEIIKFTVKGSRSALWQNRSEGQFKHNSIFRSRHENKSPPTSSSRLAISAVHVSRYTSQ